MATSPVSQPRSTTARNAFRVVGVVAMLVALTLIAIALVDFFTVGDDFGDQPTKFWMFFLGVPFFAVGGFCLQAGFVGVASQYAAGQTSGAVREFGSAFRGDGPVTASAARGEDGRTGKFCSECGVRADAGARFCDACGHGLA